MGPGEMVARAGEQARRRAWRGRQVRPGDPVPPIQATHVRPAPAPLDPALAIAVAPAARGALVAAAERLRSGRWETLGVERDDLDAPDWFLDPISQRRAPSERYAFRIQHRSEAETGNVKQVWELSRHQHLTVLAAAFFVTGDAHYAELVDRHLRSWWRQNPFLSGIHWTSGIEVGLRLIAWTWIRRLLDDWPAVGDLFERNEDAARQLYWHQAYLAAFPSVGTSANNHAVAEAAGLLVAACGLPWFEESDTWRARATTRFERVLRENTFPSGVNRELASDYHGFVAELGLTGALEAEAAGIALDPRTWQCLCGMLDAAAALTDIAGRPPRQGDGDEGVGLLIDGPNGETPRWAPIVAVGAAVFGPLAWWPRTEPTVFSTLLGSLSRNAHHVAGRPRQRPSHFADAGLTLLRRRSGAPDAAEIWCRCDGGPHGFLATAAHAHADALSIEVRHDGVDILADPGTYCYHGEPEWRSYFRSTGAHNTLEIAGRDQSRPGGPFLWMRAARTRVLSIEHDADGEPIGWCAEHDGYADLSPPARHRRTVRIDEAGRRLEIVDHVVCLGHHPVALHFQLGPSVETDLDNAVARLEWKGRDSGAAARATLLLPAALRWSACRAETVPAVRGWYSPGFGAKTAANMLAGEGACNGATLVLHTTLVFDD